MAGFDTINNMSNAELLKFYEYCMVSRFAYDYGSNI